VIEGDH
jgi:hypothetical protein